MSGFRPIVPFGAPEVVWAPAVTGGSSVAASSGSARVLAAKCNSMSSMNRVRFECGVGPVLASRVLAGGRLLQSVGPERGEHQPAFATQTVCSHKERFRQRARL